MAEKELQEKMLMYRILEARLDGLVKQRDFVASKIIELQTTLASIDEVEKSNGEILFPIGGEAYTRADSVQKGKLIISIGANVALEKTAEEGKVILSKRKSELEKAANEMQNEIVKISNTLSSLAPEIQELSKNIQPQAG